MTAGSIAPAYVAIVKIASTGPPLFERRIHRGEFGVEGGADAVDGGDDDNTEADRDQAIFDGGGAGFIVQESRNQLPHAKLLWTLPRGSPAAMAPAESRLHWLPAC